MMGNEGRFEEFDTVGRQTPMPAGGARPRLLPTGLSLPSAVIGALLVGALALGVGGIGPVADLTAGPAGGAGVTQDGPVSGDGTGSDGGVLANRGDGGGTSDGFGPASEDTTPGETSEPKGTPGPDESPDEWPAPDVERVNLDAAERDGKVRLEWGACAAADVAYWKVVRSGDETVRWPLGDRDRLVAALEPAAGSFTDGDAPEGRKSWYRVFAVAKVEGELVVRCASDTERVFVPGPEPTEKPEPTPKPEPEPTPKPETGTLELAVKVKDGHPFLDWSPCKADGFDYYKVVASRDELVKWPAGDNDWMVAAIGERDVTAMWDRHAPAGKAIWYRVFCVDATGDGYRILAASPARKVVTPEDPGPKPDPAALWIEAGVDGSVVWLDWESCDSDTFVYYKVLRARHDDPSYLPWTEGTQLIGVIEHPGASAFEDRNVASGEAWWYRVQSIGKWNGQKVLLGETRAVRVEVP